MPMSSSKMSNKSSMTISLRFSSHTSASFSTQTLPLDPSFLFNCSSSVSSGHNFINSQSDDLLSCKELPSFKQVISSISTSFTWPHTRKDFLIRSGLRDFHAFTTKSHSNVLLAARILPFGVYDFFSFATQSSKD